MMRYRIRALTAVAILTIATNAWADNAVTRWVEQALQTVRVQNIGSPASRLYAMVTVAMYDAVNGIDRARHLSTREDALVSLPGAPAFGDRRAAAAAAAHAVLKSFVPEGSAQASALDAALTAELESLARAPQAAVDAGRAWGAAVGEAVIGARANDNTQTPETKPAGTGLYVYRADFADAQFRSMVPFGIESIDPYVATNLPDLASDRYAESFNETKALGDVNDPDATRREIARHWQAGANTTTELGLWFKAALDVVERRGTSQSLSRTARLFALLGMAIADGFATAWQGKFEAFSWRPGTAIREADLDGNPNTDVDRNWTPRNVSFGSSPEYPSGTSTLAGAASTALAGFYCTDRVHFQFTGEGAGAVTRRYRRFSEAADEAGVSRIYLGLHFRFSKEDGLASGQRVGREIVTTRLRRAGRCVGISCICPQW